MFEWQILKKKNVSDVLVDLEEAFFNDLTRAYITETSPYKSYPRFPPNIYSQGPKEFPQRRNFHRLQCIFMFTEKFTTLLLANTFLWFWCHLKVN